MPGMAAQRTVVMVGTRKGLFELGRRASGWEIIDAQFFGYPVTAVLSDADGQVYAALDLGHFGAKLWRRTPAHERMRIMMRAAELADQRAGDRTSGAKRAFVKPEKLRTAVRSEAATARGEPSSRVIPHTADCLHGSSSTIWKKPMRS